MKRHFTKEEVQIANKNMVVGWKWVSLSKGNMRDPHSDGNVLYLDYINVSVLVAYYVTVLQDVVMEKLSKEFMGSPCIIPYNSM